MLEQLDNALYVYGVVRVKESKSQWVSIGLEGNQVFILSIGEMGALVHKCKLKPYAPKDPEKVKELIVEHNCVLEKAMKDFGNVLPFSFNIIVQEKNGKTAEENLKNWLKQEEKNFEQLWKKIKRMKEYGIKFFYDRKKWTEEIETQITTVSGKSNGINYLLKGIQKYKVKDEIIKKIKEKKQEIFEGIKTKVQEIKIVQPKVKLMEEERDLLLCISILANEKQFNDVKQFLQENMSEEDYKFAGPFPPYSFVESIENE